jgi:outer membrane protein TolC
MRRKARTTSPVSAIEAGLDNYLSVLSSQNQVLLTQTLRAELQARRLTYSVDLVRAGRQLRSPGGLTTE